MLDGLRGTEQEHIEHYSISFDTECASTAQAGERYSCGGIYTSRRFIGGGSWQAPHERYQNIEQMYQTTSGGLGPETSIWSAPGGNYDPRCTVSYLHWSIYPGFNFVEMVVQ